MTFRRYSAVVSAGMLALSCFTSCTNGNNSSASSGPSAAMDDDIDAPMTEMAVDNDFAICLSLRNSSLVFKSTSNGGCTVEMSDSSASSENHYNGDGGKIGIGPERLPVVIDMSRPLDEDDSLDDTAVSDNEDLYLIVVTDIDDTLEMTGRPLMETELRSEDQLVRTSLIDPNQCNGDCGVTVRRDDGLYRLDLDQAYGRDHWEFGPLQPAD